LARIVEAWPTLPAHIKAAVMALVGTTSTSSTTSSTSGDDDLDRLPWERKQQ
jgi:hypothetical protein